jgi:hypothetical protein
MDMSIGDTAASHFAIAGGEDNKAHIFMYADQGDTDDGLVSLQAVTGLGGFYVAINNGSAWDDEVRIDDDVCQVESGWTTTAVDYAEYFEWKTELADDDAVKDLYGMSVVLDGDKIRVAEEGEEADVLGVVRPSNTSSVIGGDGLYWRGRYLKDAWGEHVKEPYTEIGWYEYTSNGNIANTHRYNADRIPEYKLKEPKGTDKPNWHLAEENFALDKDGEKIPLVVPSTDGEKTAAGWIERTHNKHTGEPLMRKIFNPDFDSSQEYINRADRRTEWCIVGLLGQVPVRDTAVVPDHWKKMKNLESGIDLYYIK